MSLSSLEEKRKSLSNAKNDLLDAVVISNYGDALHTNYHFDILSRFVIVMVESALRIPTEEKWISMFAVVARPKHLWLNVEEGKAPSPNTQKRSDSLGNLSVGLAESYTVAGIPKINYQYALGEKIKIKKLASPLKFGESSFFESAFNEVGQSPNTNAGDGQVAYDFYGNWHTEGSTLPYFAGYQNRIDYLKTKGIYLPFPNLPNTWCPTLYKYQYEAMTLNLSANNPELSSYMTQIFQNELPNGDAIYSAQGGYIFKNDLFVNLLCCEYEDINIGGKERTSVSECIPNIITVPSTFPTPKARTLGLISYNPQYSTIIRT